MLLAGQSANAQLTEVPWSLKMEETKLAVEGEVIESECFHTEKGDIYTAHTVEVYRSFKSDLALDKVYIVTRGGTLEGESQTWTHLLTLHKGLSGIFLLEPSTFGSSSDQNDHYQVVASEQGFFKYREDERGLTAYEPFSQYKDVAVLLDNLKEELGNERILKESKWNYDRQPEVVHSYTRSVNDDERCLDFLFEVQSPDPDNIFHVTTVVSIRSSEPTKITRPVVVGKYNNTVLGDNIYANGLVTLEQIGISADVNYTEVIEDIAPDEIRIDIQATSLDEPDLFEITTIYTPLIKISLLLPGPIDPGLIIDQEMMETLSKYFDISESIEKYFDCMRIEGDFQAFNCPTPIITGFSQLDPLNTSTTWRAGTDDILVIHGACFGDNLGDSYVEFTNAKSGPEQEEWVQPLIYSTVPEFGNDDLIDWSDNAITLYVPSYGMNEPTWYAGTGKVRVTVDGNTVTSLDDLEIKYAVRNTHIDPSAPSGSVAPDHTLAIRLGDLNGEGGYDLYYADNFLNHPGYPTAEEAFDRALVDWRCLTYVNFVVKDEAEINDPNLACRIDFGPLPLGVSTTLAQTAPDFGECDDLGYETYFRANRFTITFNDGVIWWDEEDDSIDLIGIGASDLQSRAVHELGHAHGLMHSNNPEDLMYWTDIIEPLSYRREIMPFDEEGGVHQAVISVVELVPSGCGPWANMSLIDDCEEGPLFLSEYDSVDALAVSPNPTSGALTIQLNDALASNVRVQVFNNTGQLVMQGQNTRSAKLNIDLSGQNDGLYVIVLTSEGQFIGSGKVVLQR